MFKLITLTLVCAFALGCAAIQPVLDDVVPQIEIAAGSQGITLDLDAKLGVNTLCVDRAGKVAGFFGLVLLLGDVVLNLVACPDAPVPAPEV